MSDIIEEKSAEEQLEAVVKDTVATKADKADLDAYTKSEDFVKAIEEVKEEAKAALEEAKAENLEALESKLNNLAAPAIKKGSDGMIKFEDIQTENGICKGQVFTKSVTDNTDIAGGRVNTRDPWFKREQMNVLRNYSTVLPSSGAGVYKLPNLSGISWASEASAPVNTPRTPGGTLADTSITVLTWVSENQANNVSLQDVPGMDGAMVGLMAAQLGTTEAADAVAVIKAFDFDNARETTTGVATGFPTTANVFGKTIDMITGVEASYRTNARFFMSRGYFSAVTQSNNTGINFNPVTGLNTIAGYDVILVDALEDASVDGNLTAVFGDMAMGLALVSSESMNISRYEQTRPGSMTYFGEARFKHGIWDTNALSTMKIGA